jgi:hypothetical protein
MRLSPLFVGGEKRPAKAIARAAFPARLKRAMASAASYGALLDPLDWKHTVAYRLLASCSARDTSSGEPMQHQMQYLGHEIVVWTYLRPDGIAWQILVDKTIRETFSEPVLSYQLAFDRGIEAAKGWVECLLLHRSLFDRST